MINQVKMRSFLAIILSSSLSYQMVVPPAISPSEGSGDDDINPLSKRADEYFIPTIVNNSKRADEYYIPSETDNNNGSASIGNSRKKRGTFLKGVTLWDNKEIPYEIGNMAVRLVPEVPKVMRMIEKYSCVKFIGPDDSNYDAKKANGFLKFVDGEHCSSKNGKVTSPGAFQELRLGDNCNMRVAVHELMHTVGIKHEHKRADRDNYIRINEDQIKDGFMFQFEGEPASAIDMSRPYDISSIMHYSSWSYAKGDAKTIDMIHPLYSHSQGGVDNLGGNVRGNSIDKLLSHRDKATLNGLYSCDENCGGKTCQNGGYVDKDCQCQCPQGFVGDDCGTFDATSVGHHSKCGPSELSGSGIIKPPLQKNKQKKKGFISGISCFWRITAPEGQKVEVKLQKFWLDKKNDGSKWSGMCKANYLSVDGAGALFEKKNLYPDWLQIYLYGSEVDVQPISCLPADRNAIMSTWASSEGNQVFIKWTSTRQTVKDFFTGNDITFSPALNKAFKLEYRTA